MRSMMKLFGTVFLSVALAVSGGCSGKKTDPKEKDHKDHKDDDHKDHKDDDHKDDHDHPTKGPSGGVLAEWGKEEYHPEFVVDHKAKKVTVNILDKSAKKVAPIEAETISVTITSVKPPVQITLKADPQKDDPKGKSSRFVGEHEKLGEDVPFRGEISGKVGTKPYSGKFVEKEHDHKDHKFHKDDDHKKEK